MGHMEICPAPMPSQIYSFKYGMVRERTTKQIQQMALFPIAVRSQLFGARSRPDRNVELPWVLQSHSGEAEHMETHNKYIGNDRKRIIQPPTTESLWRGIMYGTIGKTWKMPARGKFNHSGEAECMETQ